jgi:hypothetical protein
MDFYTKNQGRTEETVRARHPRRDDEKPETYNRAVKARVFDIMRGFLPAGICTQLSWHTNLRQAGDNLTRLSMHPAPEMNTIATAVGQKLHERYSSSGFNTHVSSVSGIANKDAAACSAQETWERQMWAQHTYVDAMDRAAIDQPHMAVDVGDLARKLHPYMELLKTRPRGCRLPHVMTRLGLVTAEFLIDFGSFRDIQRHRNGVVSMPLLDTSHGFEKWYVEQLDEELQKEAWALIDEQRYAIAALLPEDLKNRSVLRQYYTALGFKVPTTVAMGLPALLYMLEMRSSKTVHPTLRSRVRLIAKRMNDLIPDLVMHIDNDADDWTVRRGEQTITVK